MNLSQEITRELLNIKAVQINTEDYFTWTSGIKSPIYCDNRLTMSYPEVRSKICETFENMIENLDDKPDVIAGCATAGIPHAAWLAEKLNLPMVYVRSSAKKHGKQNQIEGELKKGQKILVIEDLISTGGSAIEAAKILEKAGGNVIAVFAIFTYGLSKATHSFTEVDIPFQTITSFDLLIEQLAAKKQIQEDDKEDLLTWRDSLG